MIVYLTKGRTKKKHVIARALAPVAISWYDP